MSNTLLYPMTVSAKVVKGTTKVPALFGTPFNRDAVLEAGIHVHWSLPDALTAANVLHDKGSQAVVFPAVPDLWLVIRFNAGISSSTPTAQRTWTAWIVDSIRGTVTPLAQWTPPADRDASQVHTFAGVLPNATSVGYSGWGLWDTDVSKHPGGVATFDPAMAAYYPESRKRFGFYDSLADLPARKGNVSYMVMGWYWSQKHDPLGNAFSPVRTLEKWKTTATTASSVLQDIVPHVDPRTASQVTAAWKVEPKLAQVHPPSLAQIQVMQRNITKSGSLDLQVKKLDQMQTLFPVQASAPQPAVARIASDAPLSPALSLARENLVSRTVSLGAHLVLARETICHGSVVGVPLAGSGLAPVPVKSENVKLYPNVKRALAEIASLNGSTDQVNAVEMLLADLDTQRYSTGGVIDMPGAAHAYTFQSVPGKARIYARIDVEAIPVPPSSAPVFSLASSEILKARAGSGFWPQQKAQSVSITASRLAKIPGLQFATHPATPAGPTEAQKAQFLIDIRSAFATALQDATANGTAMDAQMIRVQDSRSNARSLNLGETSDGSGSDSAGWWINIQDDEGLKQLLITTVGAKVSMPSAANLYEQPGPRWYRPWSPQLVLSDIGRTYKFGFDTRFRADATVQARLGGSTLTSITAGKRASITGISLLAHPQTLNVAGVPPVVQALAAETLLLDPESAGAMAAATGPVTAVVNPAASQADYTAAIRGVLFARDTTFKAALSAVSLQGEQPSPVAITPWQEPFDPLFLDADYSHPHNDMDAWTLRESDVEMSPPGGSSAPGQPTGVESFQERTMITASVTRVLQSALVSRVVIDPRGNRVIKQKVSKDLSDDTFAKMDVVSAPLTKFDALLFERGFRLRAGSLRMNHIDVVDMFGFTRPWSSGIAPESLDPALTQPFSVPMPPRFPFWSRFNFRLMSADTPEQEASTKASPVCGLLLPDFLEHALEVFDSAGSGLGQLTTDIPIHGATDGTTLTVTYTPHPWLESNADPFFHILNPTLRALVTGIVAQPLVVPKGNVEWAETGLSAMLRIIDTIRGTFDPSVKVADRKVSLIGKPIVVMGARLQFNGTSTDDTAELSGDPPLLTEPPTIPSITVRIGDATRPDDGVLGLFIPGTTPEESRFAPVTTEAATKALVNALSATSSNVTEPATHPFVKDQQSMVTVPANTPVDVVLLADVQSGIYATCGALPRKKIAIPKDFIDPVVAKLEPSFFVGPVLVTQQLGSEKVLIPPPEVAGYGAEFLYEAPGETTFASAEVPTAPPLTELPKSRVMLTDGWLRMVPEKKKPA